VRAAGGTKAATKAAPGAAELAVVFDRLLLGKHTSQALTISNTGVLPFAWRLAGAAQLPAEFKVVPSSGELAARSDVRVTVLFSALKKAEFNETLVLEVWCKLQTIHACHVIWCSWGSWSCFNYPIALINQVLDVQGTLGVARAIPIGLRAEAHAINVDVRFPPDGVGGVDFGNVRVMDDAGRTVVLRNTEKYDVRFEFVIQSELLAQLLSISPEAGVLVPGKEVPITVRLSLYAMAP
jgi:hydrocephalus-inducing protein